MSELVIRGGTVVDGTGSPGRKADVSVDGGRISAIGDGLDGDRVLEADGHVVAPGFIDIHTHYDAQVFWDPRLTPSCFHGVTTVVAGNCGFSIAPTRPEHRDLIAHTLENVEDMDVAALEAGIPWDFSTFPEYLASVERRGLGLNFAAYLGHTALRLFVMGDDAYERSATVEEITRMQAVLSEGLEAGAAGFATSSAPTHFGAAGKKIPSPKLCWRRSGPSAGVRSGSPRGTSLSKISTIFNLPPECRSPTAPCSRSPAGGTCACWT
jgi:N-acyl-D-amino-acid deacylase